MSVLTRLAPMGVQIPTVPAASYLLLGGTARDPITVGTSTASRINAWMTPLSMLTGYQSSEVEEWGGQRHRPNDSGKLSHPNQTTA